MQDISLLGFFIYRIILYIKKILYINVLSKIFSLSNFKLKRYFSHVFLFLQNLIIKNWQNLIDFDFISRFFCSKHTSGILCLF